MICAVYIFPLNGRNGYLDLALRFIQSYARFPAGANHQMVVVCNGPITNEAECLFSQIPDCIFLEHDNSGYDIGGFQKAAREIPVDLMVFFGATAYLKGPNWLARMEEAWKAHGDTLYGAMGNRGNGSSVQPHVRTTGFWISSDLFNQYPHQVIRPEHRYMFEHSEACLTSWIKRRRLSPFIVSWTGVHSEAQWDSIPNGYHNGNQSNLLVGDRLTMPPYYHIP